ncbi:MAG: protein translocase SEC61 complex subunit gamma [Euryarchaeota archaeon]|nr:protein translocase SEC61 complex subunit gamma [Euryarchaeota archaeon]
MVSVAILKNRAQLVEKLKEWQRVVKLSRKPRRSEYLMVAKVTGAGIIIIGLLAFIIRMLLHLGTLLRG